MNVLKQSPRQTPVADRAFALETTTSSGATPGYVFGEMTKAALARRKVIDQAEINLSKAKKASKKLAKLTKEAEKLARKAAKKSGGAHSTGLDYEMSSDAAAAAVATVLKSEIHRLEEIVAPRAQTEIERAVNVMEHAAAVIEAGKPTSTPAPAQFDNASVDVKHTAVNGVVDIDVTIDHGASRLSPEIGAIANALADAQDRVAGQKNHGRGNNRSRGENHGRGEGR